MADLSSLFADNYPTSDSMTMAQRRIPSRDDVMIGAQPGFLESLVKRFVTDPQSAFGPPAALAVNVPGQAAANIAKRVFSGPERDKLVMDLYEEIGKSANVFAKKFGLGKDVAEDLSQSGLVKLLDQLNSGVRADIPEADLPKYLLGGIHNDMQSQVSKLGKDIVRQGVSLDEMVQGAEGLAGPALQIAESGAEAGGLNQVGRVLKDVGVPQQSVPVDLNTAQEALQSGLFKLGARAKGGEVNSADRGLADMIFRRGLTNSEIRASGLKFDTSRAADLRKSVGDIRVTYADTLKALGFGPEEVRGAVNTAIDNAVASNPRTNLKNLRNTATQFLTEGPPKLSSRQRGGRSGSSAESLNRRVKTIYDDVVEILLKARQE